jgi:diacylglycerol O-acyltransferase
MKRLNVLDTLFLRLERRNAPLHVGALSLFTPPADAPPDFGQQLAEQLRESTQAMPPFNRRLTSHLGLHFWEEDADFDMAHHFVHLSLPRPGRIRELLAMVSRVHSAHLDRAYPLWRTYLIEGLEDGRIATYSKIHHALVDGVAGIRLLIKSMAPTPAESLRMPPPWEVRTRKSGAMGGLPVPIPTAGGLAAVQGLATEGVRKLPGFRSVLAQAWRDLRTHHPDLVHGLQAPRSILNQKISGSRRFAAQSYSTARIKAVAQAFGSTSNDVVLAMCGGALRRYLLSLHELPNRPLVAAVPVSIRRDDGDMGNEVGFALTTLATDLEDPAERLRVIISCMNYSKARLRQLTPPQMMAYAAVLLLPGAFNFVTGLGETTAANVVVSHVPGPRAPMYWQGCALSGIYPVSLVLDGLALNITLVSRQDYIDFGLIGCRKTLPSLQRLLDDLEDELAALEASLNAATGRRARSRR